MHNVSIVVISKIKIYSDEISERHESVLTENFKPALATQLVKNGVNLVHLEPSSCIAALFVCENQNDLKNLEHLYVIGELQSMLEELFTNLLASTDPQVTVHIKNIVWELSDYLRCATYLSILPSREFFASDK